MSLFEIFDNFMSRREQRLQQMFGQSSGRVIHFRQPQRERPTPLFGAGQGFGLDWASYRTSKPQGPGVQPIQSELKQVDADANLERWVPDSSIPSLTSHGRKLNYSNETDQRPTKNFQGEIGEKWDGKIRATEPRKSLEGSRTRSVTQGDKEAADLRRYPYDFSF